MNKIIGVLSQKTIRKLPILNKTASTVGTKNYWEDIVIGML